MHAQFDLVLGGSGAITVFGASPTVGFDVGGFDPYVGAAGGGGDDVFVFGSGSGGADVIAKFDATRDLIVLAGYTPREAARALQAATTANGTLTLGLRDGTTITVLGISALPTTAFG